jgi:hypothetical protein
MLKMFCGLTRDEKDYLEDVGLCGALSFKWVLKNKNGWLGLDLSAPVFERVAGFCEHNNEILIL